MKIAAACWLALMGIAASAPAQGPIRPSGAWSRPPAPGCRWEQVEGAALSIGSYHCPAPGGGLRLIPDDVVGGFALVDGNAQPRIVIRSFVKPAGAPVSAALPAILRATGQHRKSCELVSHPGYASHRTVWLLEPTGREKAAFDAADAREPQAEPCGILSNGVVGERYFRILPGDPTRLVFVDEGSEIQVFEADTLRLR